MSVTALARKYRSRNFDELVGQEHVVKALSHALSTGRLHHAYLLTGTRGVGKTTIARILAKCLNCETGVTAKPCGVCSTCQSVDQGRFVDLLELDAASNTGVNDMREIIENARYAPTAGRYKVYLIDEVHMLSNSAFNAMLKTLEEPPEHVKFVLATTDPQKIPVTVLSRCLQFNLKQLPADLIGGHLKAVLNTENVAHDAEAVALIARAAAGSMRDALSITDQAIAFGHGKLVAEQVRAMLGVVDNEYLLRLAHALAAHDGGAVLAEIETLYTRGVSFESVLQELGLLFHDLALKQAVPAARLSGDWNVDDLVDAFTPETVQVLYQIALGSRRDLSLAPDERAGLTMALLRMLAFVPESGDAQVAPVRAQPSVREKPLRAPGPSVSVRLEEAPEIAENLGDLPSKSAVLAPQVFEEQPQNVLAETPSAAASKAESPAVCEPTTSAATSVGFDNDWPTLIARLPLVALTREFARNTALVKHVNNTFYVSLPDDKRPLLKQQAKLKEILCEYFGKPIRLEVDFASVAAASAPQATVSNTLAQQETAERSERKKVAQEAFVADPFVQALVRDTNAIVHMDAIQPIGEA